MCVREYKIHQIRTYSSFACVVAIGLGYTFALIAIAFIRELLGTGVLFAGSDGTGGIRILGDWYTPASIFILPPGAFLTLGFLVAMFKLVRTKAEKKGEKSAEADESSEEEEAVAE